jgi:hypothetical protein
MGYLRWLMQKNGYARTALLCDAFSADPDGVVRELAATLDLQLLFIPSGETDIFQPLAVGISGPM